VQMGPDGAFDVPKTGFLVFGKKVSAFLGGATARGMSSKRGFLFSEKRFWCFWGVQRRAACPQNGVSCFRKKGFGVFGGATARGAKCGMSPKRGFLFSKKRFRRFWGGCN